MKGWSVWFLMIGSMGAYPEIEKVPIENYSPPLPLLSLTSGSDTIYYDDGNCESPWYLRSGGGYWAVRFTPLKEFTLESALISLQQTHNDACKVSLYSNGNGKPGTLEETVDFISKDGWQEIAFSKTYKYDSDFWLVFEIPTSENGPRVCGDGDGGEHSYYSTDGTTWHNFTEYSSDFLIRAVGEYTKYDHDVRVNSILSPGFPCEAGTPVKPEAEIENVGKNTESFDVECVIEPGGYKDTKSISNLDPGSTKKVTFSDWTPSPNTYYEVKVYTKLSGDASPKDDTLSILTATYPRTVLAELFTATWCPPCSRADPAADRLAEEEGLDKLALLQYHTTDKYGTAETRARANYYGVSSIPNMWWDGTLNDVGAGSVNDTYNRYKRSFEKRSKIPSPVTIELSGKLEGEDGSLDAKVEAKADISLSQLKLRFVLAENKVDEYNHVVRDILPDESVSLSKIGDKAEVHRDFTLKPEWDISNMECVVFLQSDATKEVLGAKGGNLYDMLGIEEKTSKPISLKIATVVKDKSLVQFYLPASQYISLKIYDAMGRAVRTLFNGKMESGSHSFLWDTKRMASGIYFCVLKGENSLRKEKVTVIY